MPQDYVLRLVEQIARMLASIVRKRLAGEHQAAKCELEALCLEHIGLTLESTRRMSPEALSEALSGGGLLRHTRGVALAEILIHDAELSEAAGRAPQALISRLHAHCLLADSFELLSREERANYLPKLAALAKHLAPLRHDPYVAAKLSKVAAV